MEERNQAKSFEYTFKELLQQAVPEFKSPCREGPFLTCKKDSYLFIMNIAEHFFKRADGKFHFNISMPSDAREEEKQFIIARAWDAIVPVFLNEKAIVMQAKVMVPLIDKETNARIDAGIKTRLQKTETDHFPGEERRFFKKLDAEEKTALREERERNHTAVVTLYIYNDVINKINVEGYKRIIQRVEANLKVAGITPGPTSESDYRVSDYTSFRIGQDSNGKYLNIYQISRLEKQKKFKTLPVTRAFVAEHELKQLRACKIEPALMRSDFMEQDERKACEPHFQNIINITTAFLTNPDFIKWTRGNIVFENALQEMKNVLSYRILHPELKIFCISNIALKLIENLAFSKEKKEHGFFSTEKSAPEGKEDKVAVLDKNSILYQFFDAFANFDTAQSEVMLRFLEQLILHVSQVTISHAKQKR